jgi:tyrosine-protein kinase
MSDRTFTIAVRGPAVERTGTSPVTVADYLSVLWRRKWILIVLPLLTGVVAYAITQQGTPTYRADARVLLSRTDVVSGVTNTQDPAVFDSPRYLRTQASIARSPTLATRVVSAARVSALTPAALLRSSSVTPEAESDLLRFSFTSLDAENAMRVVNAYASEFTKFKSELDTVRVDNALREIRTRLRSLERRDLADGAAYQALTQYQSQLLIGRLLLADGASVLEPASGASQLGATPQRNLFVGVLFGLVVALGLAFLAEALDRRVRDEDEIEEALALPLLERIPTPPAELAKNHRLVMLADPLSVYSESFRRLRTNLEFVNRDGAARTIMFTSAVPKEGKSTTVANLAVAYARSGKRVVLVDLDVRRPTQHRLFGVRPDHGIAEVVLGRDTLERAIQQIMLPAASRPPDAIAHGVASSSRRWSPATLPIRSVSSNGPDNGRTDTESVLHLLVGGAVPRAHGEFLNHERVAQVIDELADTFDLVLVDSPPLLAVGDAMTLSAKVDAMVVVTRLELRRPVLHELARQIQQCPARPLGFVVTGVGKPDGYAYGYGYGSETTAIQPPRAAERAR